MQNKRNFTAAERRKTLENWTSIEDNIAMNLPKNPNSTDKCSITSIKKQIQWLKFWIILSNTFVFPKG